VSSFYGTALSRPAFALYVTAGDAYRQRAAKAKDRAAQAKDPSIKSAFENVAAGWVALAEQVERIDEEKSPRTGPRKWSLGPLTDISRTFWDYARTFHWLWH
jgi:hypothetical protein